MDIKKTATITLNETEVRKIIAEHLSKTTEYKVEPNEVHFNLGNEPSEFGGQPTPYIKNCEIKTLVK
jgi:hypothetical protein